jgi:delta-aminolevulinic acid dehydratase/porphobilinogen synthase
MVTLSHYLLNANVVIGGEVRHSRKSELTEDVLASLEVIEQQAKKIDSVIQALRKITAIKTANYTSEGHDLMIDITEEIDEQLQILKSPETGKNKTV